MLHYNHSALAIQMSTTGQGSFMNTYGSFAVIYSSFAIEYIQIHILTIDRDGPTDTVRVLAVNGLCLGEKSVRSKALLCIYKALLQYDIFESASSPTTVTAESMVDQEVTVVVNRKWREGTRR